MNFQNQLAFSLNGLFGLLAFVIGFLIVAQTADKATGGIIMLTAASFSLLVTPLMIGLSDVIKSSFIRFLGEGIMMYLIASLIYAAIPEQTVRDSLTKAYLEINDMLPILFSAAVMITLSVFLKPKTFLGFYFLIPFGIALAKILLSISFFHILSSYF